MKVKETTTLIIERVAVKLGVEIHSGKCPTCIRYWPLAVETEQLTWRHPLTAQLMTQLIITTTPTPHHPARCCTVIDSP